MKLNTQIISFLLFLCTLVQNGTSYAQKNTEKIKDKISSFDLEALSEEDTYYLDSCVFNFNSLFSIQEKTSYHQALITSFEELKKFSHALHNTDSLIAQLKGNDYLALADAYTSKSLEHDILGDYPNALAASQNALALYIKIDDKSGEAYTYNDIAILHYYRGDNKLSQNYLEKSYDIFLELKDTAGLSLYYNNMANTLYEEKDYEKAIRMYEQAFEFDKIQGNVEGQSIALSNIGDTYLAMDDFEKAESALLEALVYAEYSEDDWAIISSLQMLGDLFIQTKEYYKADRMLKKSLQRGIDIGALPEVAGTYELLYTLQKQKGDFSSALDYYEKYTGLQDTIFDQNKERAILEMESKYQIEDKAQEIKLLQSHQHIEELMFEKKLAIKEKQSFYLVAGLIAFLIVIVFVVRSFILKKRANKKLQSQNDIIENKNEQLQFAYDEIETKNNEILDSIRYAKRIQTAVLPSTKSVNLHLPDSFIIYKPKDVVAGDFYWLEKKENSIMFAAADCTGHGVPGAMVSVVCNNALNRSVREHGLNVPGEILDQTRKIVIEEFEKADETVKDGMDIALCSISDSINGEYKVLNYAGAFSPLWIIRLNSGELEEVKADKQPIGKFIEGNHNFKTHSIELFKGDIIYLFTDGFSDQFGGDKGKKFKSVNFKELLIRVSKLRMEEQKEHINSSFEAWRGSLEQVDDVCVLGIKV